MKGDARVFYTFIYLFIGLFFGVCYRCCVAYVLPLSGRWVIMGMPGPQSRMHQKRETVPCTTCTARTRGAGAAGVWYTRGMLLAGITRVLGRVT